MIDWTACEVVERVPGRLGGALVVRGTRISVDLVLANAADGFAPSELSMMFPGLSEEDARRVIEFASQAAHAHPA
jgi:uncharacterized protein (DUF433 family)